MGKRLDPEVISIQKARKHYEGKPLFVDSSTRWRGNFGINRVIRTRNGPAYTAARVTVDASFTMPVDSRGFYTTDLDNKPTAYLGGNTASIGAQFRTAKNQVLTYLKDVPYETDAGLQFENGKKPLGWTADISYNAFYCNPQVWNSDLRRSTPWRGGIFSPGSGLIHADMEARFVPGGGTSLYVQGLGTFYWNSDSDARIADAAHPVAPWDGEVLNSTNQANANVKRVAGMTRSGEKERSTAGYPAGDPHNELDGSQLSVTFSDCKVGNNLLTWSYSDVNQTVTGFDAPGGGELAHDDWDRRTLVGTHVNGVSSTIVEFPGLDNVQARADFTPSPATNPTPIPYAPQRYASERVNINLRTLTQVSGLSVETAKE